ncbi:MAG: sulfatase-like hydrolase/transferase [Bdellovibrionaceae bacterium]|nr:sulfatase-like hydrolase/transferase [Pseudobdellovibrionaceae bacterium]
MMHISFLRKNLLFFGMGLLLGSCSAWEQEPQAPPNIILFSIEGLHFDRLSCGEAFEVPGGFQELCLNGVRFTHFYSPSTTSQTTMASLLTGSSPSVHRALDNGASAVEEIVQTLPEKAVAAGYSTGFISGGPPILCKSGLQQGFELCDDEFLTSDKIYRPVIDNIEKAQHWIQEQTSPFFINIYAPDTQFYNQTTMTQEGKERARGLDSQIDAIDESLGLFFKWLKKKKYWDNTIVMVMGLNGESLALRSVTWRENVFSENVHVPLLIHFPVQFKEGAKSIDNLLTHAEVGRFLASVIEARAVIDHFEHLIDEWLNRLPKFVEIRADWPTWWFGYAPVISFRTEDYLVFPKRNLEIFHTVVDKTEVTPLTEGQVKAEDLVWLQTRFDQSYDVSASEVSELYSFLREINKLRPETPKSMLQRLRSKVAGKMIVTIDTDIAVEQNQWQLLKDNPSAIVAYVAQRNLDVVKKPNLHSACERLFYGRKRLQLLRNCNDSLFLALLAWEKRRNDSDALYWEKRFIRKYRFYRQYKHLAYKNLFIDLNWHVDTSRLVGPSLTDLYLRLPDKVKLRQTIQDYKIPDGLDFLYE